MAKKKKALVGLVTLQEKQRVTYKPLLCTSMLPILSVSCVGVLCWLRCLSRLSHAWLCYVGSDVCLSFPHLLCLPRASAWFRASTLPCLALRPSTPIGLKPWTMPLSVRCFTRLASRLVFHASSASRLVCFTPRLFHTSSDSHAFLHALTVCLLTPCLTPCLFHALPRPIHTPCLSALLDWFAPCLFHTSSVSRLVCFTALSVSRLVCFTSRLVFSFFMHSLLSVGFTP